MSSSTSIGRWEELPLDLLAHIFSFLPPTSIACAMLACKHWLYCARSRPRSARPSCWLVSMPSRGTGSPSCCYVHDPDLDCWHALSLSFLPCPLRLVASVGSLLLCKLASSATLRLALLNPFNRRFRLLPDLIVPRSNPVVGVVARRTPDNAVEADSFCVIVAGGATGAGYEATIEMYDSRLESWYRIGPMPMEFAVRLTVWTPNESVQASDGVMYWVTSARAYSVVGFHVERGTWRELKVPMADRLEWAALVLRSPARLGLVGGLGDGLVCLWELREGDEWEPASTAPAELARRFFALDPRQSSTRCVGDEEGVYLFRELGSEMLVWRAWHPSVEAAPSGDRKWEWRLVGGGGGGGGSLSLPNIPIKAALLLPPLPCFHMRHRLTH